MNRSIPFVAVASILLILPGCETLQQAAMSTADDLLSGGRITPVEHAALTGGSWGVLIQQGVTAGASVLLSILGIQKIRGTSATPMERTTRKAAKAAPKAE